MGFNLSQIINKFLPIKPHSTSADGWEDPTGTGRGHLVVSETEQMKKRMARLGQVKTAFVTKASIPQNTFTIVYSYIPTNGYVGIPLKISISTTSPCYVYLQWQQRIGQGSEAGGASNIFSKYLPSAGSWDLDLNGEIMIGTGGPSLQVTMNPDNVGAFGWFSMIYAEELE